VAACWANLAAPAARAQEIRAATAASQEPITVAADWCTRWQEGVYDVWHLRGNCYLNQGLTYTRAPEAVLWIDARGAPQRPTKVIAYFEGVDGSGVAVDVRRQGPTGAEPLAGRTEGSTSFQRLETTAPLRWKLPDASASPGARPAIYDRGLEQFNPARRRQLLLAQYNEVTPSPQGGQALPPGMRRYEVYPRSDSPLDIYAPPAANGQRVAVASGGIRLLVEGLPTERIEQAIGPVGMIDVSADRVVIWTADGGGSPTSGVQGQEVPFEIYMEGNIEFRQGDRVVYADRMFYDVRRQIGVILNAELLTPLPPINGYEYAGLVRLKADAIRQLDSSHFAATNALVTTSRLEEPAYHFGSDEILFEDVQHPVYDPITGAQAGVAHSNMAEARNNFIYLRGVPVFYWPTIATDLKEPTFIIDRARVRNDSIFGTQALVDLDAYQLLGIRNKPEGTDWGLSTDYLSERGFGFGTDFQYDRPEVLGFVGPARGNFDFWGIHDNGLDNLGRGRQAIDPEEDFRFHAIGAHRQRLESGWDVTAEVGALSDRTFQEQYYETDWDQMPDPRTGVRAKRLNNNRALSIEANAQVNDFFTETQYLPRLDHYWLGESLLDDRLTWFAHSQASYADLEVASTPSEPTLNQQFTTLPGEADVEGERLITRQEIDLPIQAGVVKIVPYALGELGHWGEAIDGDPLDRAYGQAGVRASLPMWAVYPDVRDPLFNLNGLAHKVVFESEAYYADANENFDELPLYDPTDDTSITEFRRRMESGFLPPTIVDDKFDRRRYLLRSGIQSHVTSPVPEIADDLMVLRAGVRQRWQTKRGIAGNQHIVDWLTLDMNASFFPDANRDNFGQEFGLLDYDLRWHLGDRFTVLSDGAADVFGDGLTTVSAGVLINRPTRGNGYLGVRTINGPVTSNVLMGSYSYRLSEKWITTAGAAFDFDDAGNIGQSFSFTRIGESMLVTMGVNVDEAKDNIGVSFMVEPRALPKLKLTRTTGIEVPPAGAFGLE
jgi:hypothetical protein